MFVIWPSRGAALIKKEMKYAGPFGLASTLCGSVFIDRLNREKALETMRKTVQKVIDRNVSLGTCNKRLSGTVWLPLASSAIVIVSACMLVDKA